MERTFGQLPVQRLPDAGSNIRRMDSPAWWAFCSGFPVEMQVLRYKPKVVFMKRCSMSSARILVVSMICVWQSAASGTLRAYGQKYKHKSEAEIARLTPAQRVEEWVNEQVHHRYDVLDDHGDIIKKYILRDGLKALPRMIEIMDEYDPTRFREGKGARGERFDACWLMFGYIDSDAIRLRGSEEGRRAMDALERAIQRMRAAGYGQKEGHDEWKWIQNGRLELAVTYLEEAKGIGFTDRAIKDTFRLEHKILLSDEALLAFSNSLVVRDPTYPSWSDTNYFRDYTQINEAGNPLWVYTMKKPERFYEAYLEFKKTKR